MYVQCLTMDKSRQYNPMIASADGLLSGHSTICSSIQDHSPRYLYNINNISIAVSILDNLSSILIIPLKQYCQVNL